MPVSIVSTTTPRPSLTYSALVGRVIQQLRKNAGVDQVEMANALGISQPGYSKLESGGSAMSLPQIRKIARALKMTPSAILAQVEQYERQLVLQGVAILEDKDESISPAGLMLGIGLLIGLIAGG